MKALLNILLCKVQGHKRGKRLTATTAAINTFECPRCKATWTRKAKP